VLDVCSGSGRCSRAAAAGATASGLVIAVEPDADLLRAGAQRDGMPEWAPIQWLQAQPHSVPLADASVDTVLCAPVPPRNLDLRHVLPEMQRVARSGARIVVASGLGTAAEATTLLAAHGFSLAHVSEALGPAAPVWHVAGRRT